jgi:glycosyltransferase involved in cell wall biosynthesis
VVHVAQVSFFLDPERRTPERLLQDWWSLADVAEAAVVGGARVSVVQACHTSAVLVRGGATFHFVRADGAGGLVGSGEFARLLAELGADVLHVHGLCFPDELRCLAQLSAAPILAQDHANRVPRFWHLPSWRRALSAVSTVSFCAVEQAEPFLKARLLGPRTKIVEIPESTSRFTPSNQAEARAATGLKGSPCVLWVGHLDANKDPLTVLRGFAAAAERFPDMQLWCCYAAAPLLIEVQRLIKSIPLLAERVHLLGRLPHARVEQLMRAADIFVLGSRREGSGYSLVESLACGVSPVVTDIPSFRALTGGVGRLWRCGDIDSLEQALVAAAAQDRDQQRNVVLRHFESQLSMQAIGRKFNAAYAELAHSVQRPGSMATRCESALGQRL